MTRISIAISLLLLCLPGLAGAQASRYDGTVYTVNQSAPLPGAMLPVLALSGATVQICSTWNNSGCTGLLQTYQSATVSGPNQCPTSAQLYNALANACSSTADVSGGFGIWTLPGSYAYFVTASYGTFGPYPFGVDAGGAYVPSSGGTMTGPLIGPVINGMVNVTYYATGGSDIAQAFATAYAANGNVSYWIPAGTYSYSHTLAFPSIDSGNVSLNCAPGTQLNWTGGAAPMFTVLGTGQSKLGHILSGCFFLGNSSATAGIELQAANGATISNVNVESVTNGDGILNSGANSIDYNNVILSGNKNNIRNVGVVVSGTNYAANSITFTGGINANAINWGAFEDASQSGTVGANQQNTYNGVRFEANGTAGSGFGHAFVQACLKCSLVHNYFEYASGTKSAQIYGGDASYAPTNLLISDNIFVQNGATLTNTINCVNCSYPVVAWNLDEGTPTNFFNANTGCGSSPCTSGAALDNNHVYSGSTLFAFSGGTPYNMLLSNGSGFFSGGLTAGGIVDASSLTIFGTGAGPGANLVEIAATSGTGHIYTYGPDGSTPGILDFNCDTSTGTDVICGQMTSTGFSIPSGATYKISGSQIASANLSDSASLLKNCGTATFTASTTSAALSCSGVTSNSHCQATWIGATVAGGALGYTASTGSVTLTAATSNSSTAAVACSVN